MTKKASGLIREIFPHAYFLNASWDALEKGKRFKEGSSYSFLASMLFTAFALEAYLFEVGEEKLFDDWKAIEYGKSPGEKLQLLCDSGKYQLDLSKRPFQTFTEIFKFRNHAVHAKPEKIEKDIVDLDERGRPKLPKSKWLEKCNLQNATRYYEDTDKMVITLHQELKVEAVSLISPERTTWWREHANTDNSES